jgi:hypothetical protein
MVKKWHRRPGFAEKRVADLSGGAKHKPFNDRWPARHGKSGLSGHPVAENGVGQAFVDTITYQQLDLRALRHSGRQISAIFSSSRKRRPM